MGARVLEEQEVDAPGRGWPSSRTAGCSMEALGRSCVELAALAGFAASDADKVLVAPLPVRPRAARRAPAAAGEADAGARARALALGRARASTPARSSPSTAGWATRRRSTRPTRRSSTRFAERIRTGRILVNAPTAVGALGGIYNAMTPTFSLGCGTWGGSMTTDNVNYRNLLNIKAVSRRQTPPQWFRVPSDTYFNAGAIESLRTLRARRTRRDRHRCRHRGARRRRRGARATCARQTCASSRASSPSRARSRSRAGVGAARRAAARPDRRRRRRLGDRRGEGDAAASTRAPS